MAVYRNLQEQVYENAKNIEELQQQEAVSTQETQNLITNTLNDYGINYNDIDDALQLNKNTTVTGQFNVKSPVPGTEIVPLVSIAGTTNIGRDLYINGKIQIGNTAITEEQLQKLLQLIQV